MSHFILFQVWDLDLVDSLEPAFRLGKKGSKKKGTKRVGHKVRETPVYSRSSRCCLCSQDAVLSLSWNSHVDHILASGSADHTALVWDMNTASVAARSVPPPLASQKTALK